MAARKDARMGGLKWIGRVAVLLVFSAGVLVLMLWLAGKFSPKVPNSSPSETPPTGQLAGQVVAAQLVRQPVTETAIGTIRAVHETTIGSKLLARAVEVNLRAGQKVHVGDVLVRMDDTDLRAKLRQAEAAVASAEATHNQAATDEKRYSELVASKSISQQQYDNAVAAKRTSEASLQQAMAARSEAEAALDWATIRSPIDGTVVEKKVDVGDMVTPGQTLVTLFDPTRMQLVATVRESLAQRLQPGQSIRVQIKGMSKECEGAISEIVPEAQSASRSFQVKVTGPCPKGIYSGMFGRIFIPLDDEEILVIPRAAVRHVGQLQLVSVVENGKPATRAVRTGRIFGDEVEILAGLSDGEQVLVSPTPAT